jgi:cytochrome c6
LIKVGGDQGPDHPIGGRVGPSWHWLVALVLGLFFLLALFLPPPALGFSSGALAAEPPDRSILQRGGRLFEAHCVGCHVQGGNIIRRAKTLKLAALQRNGIDHPEAIATIAEAGIGTMGGYGEALGEGGPEAVAAWVWQQALDGWPRG